MTWKMQCRSG